MTSRPGLRCKSNQEGSDEHGEQASDQQEGRLEGQQAAEQPEGNPGAEVRGGQRAVADEDRQDQEEVIPGRPGPTPGAVSPVSAGQACRRNRFNDVALNAT